ncbi:hypothetical protein BC939DRAFT_149093 [Gamsiella multidivaricata]|uniref:uncharacterized protein n=1 Tax=Gamsiella multidivaricata TaxID=101098 RepID=UPI00221F8D17|nr:uncharacterized protein BC939DRAFT_149093 [Gamsiella multidivaricata]KAI7831754.1 hypothetical protein BC939DRAFT_149093 [Gamsiella multidivaricata]
MTAMRPQAQHIALRAAIFLIEMKSRNQVQSGLPTSEAASRVGAKWPCKTDFMDSPLSNREHGKELFKLPFYAYPEEKADNNDDVDVVSLAETSTKGVDKVFNVEPFVFTGCLSDIDTGTEFTNYFNECATLKYNRAAIPDFLLARTAAPGERAYIPAAMIFWQEIQEGLYGNEEACAGA